MFKHPPPPRNSEVLTKLSRIPSYVENTSLTLIFWVVSWKALPASYDPPQWYFFSLQGMTWRKHKVPKIKKILPYEMKFLVPNYSCLQNPWLGGYRPKIPVLSLLCPQLNLLNPPLPEKNSWVRHCNRSHSGTVQNRRFTENLMIIWQRSSALRQYNLYSLQLRRFTSTFQCGVCLVVFSWRSVSDASY